jgi:hypothetical protein
VLLDRVRSESSDGLTPHVFARNSAARAFYERAGAPVLEAGDGSDDEEALPGVRCGWPPRGPAR